LFTDVEDLEEIIKTGCLVEQVGIHVLFNFLDKVFLHWAVMEIHLHHKSHDAVVIDGEVERIKFGDGVSDLGRKSQDCREEVRVKV
jgi:hypothetical protein